MRKILVVLIIFTLLLVGCDKNNEQENKEILESQLKEYANNIFDIEWLSGGIKAKTYTVTLSDIKDKLGFDTSMFKNKDGDDCDFENTKIEFIVKEQIVPDKTNYELKYYIECD